MGCLQVSKQGSKQIGCSVFFSVKQLFDYQCSMLTRTYSLAQLTTLLTTTRQQVTDILMNPSIPNNQQYFQNFTTISLRTLKYINHYLNQIHADQQLGSLIDSIINALNDTLADYKGRNIFNDSCRVFPLGEDDKEEDQIYHFMNTRNNLIPLECLGSPEMDQQRLELAEFVQSMEKKRSTHYKQPKKSAQIPIKEANKLKVFRKATFDPKLTTILEQENKNKLFRAETPQINIRESQEMEVQTDLGAEAEKLTDKENIELRSQDQSMLTSDGPVLELKKSQMSEIIENGNDSDKNKLSTKSHKRLGNKKSGKPKKKGKNNEPFASKFYSRQNSRNAIASEQSTQKLQLSHQPSIRCFKTEKENLAISSQQVNFTFNNLNRTDISLGQSNQSTPSEDIKSRREIIQQQRLNGSPKSTASRKKIGFWPQQTQSMRKINLSNFSRKDISDTEKKIIQNDDTINKSLKQIEKQIHSEPLNLFTTFSKEQRQKIEPQQPLQTIVETQELVVPSPMRVKKKDLRAMMAKNPTIYPTTNSFQYKGQAVQKAQGTYKEQSGSNNRRITSLNMKPEYLQENTEKKKNTPSGFQTQNSSDLRDNQNRRKQKKFTNSTFKRQQKQKQAVEDLIQQGERPQSVISRNSQDVFLQNQYSRLESPKDNQMSLFKVKKASSSNNNKFYATMDNFGKYMSSQQKNAASRGNSLIKVVNKTSSVHQQFLSTAASTKPSKNSNSVHEFSRLSNFRKKNQQERLSSINFKKQAKLHEQKDGNVTDKNELKAMWHKYASESSNGSLHPIQEPTRRSDCLLSRNPHKINQSNVISGVLSQEQLKSDQKKKGFPKKGGHKSVHTSLDQYELRELSRELRQKGRKQTLEHYLQLIQLTHQRFCGNNCSHMTKLFKKQNGGNSTQDETVIHQLVRIYKKENLKPRLL